jgi:hypothetical protein
MKGGPDSRPARITVVSAAEDRLRDALAARAAQVRHVPPRAAQRAAALMERPAHSTELTVGWAGIVRRWARQRRRLLAPLAAAAAVGLVIATVLAELGNIRPTATPPAPSTPALVADGGPAHQQPFFVTVDRTGATIWNTGTGRITTSLGPPEGHGSWSSVAGTADSHVFFLAALVQDPIRPNHPLTCQQPVYRLQLGEAGTEKSLRKVATLPAKALVGARAAPDGNRIAYAFSNARGLYSEILGPAEIDVQSLATGVRTIYSNPSTSPANKSSLMHLSVAPEQSPCTAPVLPEQPISSTCVCGMVQLLSLIVRPSATSARAAVERTVAGEMFKVTEISASVRSR